MKIKALVPFSNGTLSMEQYQVAEVTDTLGNQLIAAGVAIEIGGGGSGGGVLAVNVSISDNVATLDKTFEEIAGADGVYIKAPLGTQGIVLSIVEESYGVEIAMANTVEDRNVSFVAIQFYASSASGYPSATLE